MSYSDKESMNEAVGIVSFNNLLKFSVVKNAITNTLDFQLIKINGNLPVLKDKKYTTSLLQR